MCVCFLIVGVIASVQAEDIINTLSGYDQHSAWAAAGPNATDLGSGRPYGDTDIAWRFFSGAVAHYVTIVELPLSEASWLNGRIADIMIWTDTIGEPVFGHVPGEMLESVRITNAPIGTPGLCTAAFSGTNRLAAGTYYWVALSVPGNEQMRWWQDEFNLSDARGAWRKDLGLWQAPTLGGNAGAMRVAGPVAGSVGSGGPVITHLALTSAGLVLRGTNGTPLQNYRLLHATNVVLPMAQWTAVVTNTFDSGGAFECTNTLPLAAPQGYFRLMPGL